MALLDSLFGQTPSYYGGLLGEDELSRLRQQAQEQGTLNTAMALLQAGAPSRTPGGGALAIAQGLQQGQQAYRQALNQGLEEKMTGLKVQDLLRKRQEEEAVRRFLPQIMQPGQVEQNWQSPEQIGQFFQTGAMPTQRGPSTINRDALQQLALASPEQFAKISTGLKAFQPEYKEAGGMLYEIPTYGGEVRKVAGQEKLTYQDLGNVVIALDSSGKEVGRLAKGLAPQGPTSLQALETENGFVTFNPRTGAVNPLTAGGQQLTGKGGLTEGQGNAVAYGMRMQQAHDILKPLETAGLKDTGKIRSLVSGTVGATPLIGDALSRGTDNIFNVLPTVLGGLNEDQQKAVQGRVNFITAVLRKESGASIAPTEFATAEKNYFPAPGDSEAIVKQKQQARETAIQAMKLQAGKGAKYISSQQNEWSVVK
jgi:hypothetical protein